MTPSFDNSEQKVKCEREECITALRDVALFTTRRVEYSSERVINYNPDVKCSGEFVQTK